MIWNGRHPIGESIVGSILPFSGLFQGPDFRGQALSYTYRLSQLAAFVAYSPAKTSFGFSLEAAFYKIGIQYTNEWQPLRFLAKRVNHTYVFAGLDL